MSWREDLFYLTHRTKKTVKSVLCSAKAYFLKTLETPGIVTEHTQSN